MDPDPRLSRRHPSTEPSSEDPVPPNEPLVTEAPAPKAPWIGVVASRGAGGVLGAWTASRVVVSRDDGRHYHTVLDGKDDVAKVAMDDAGTLFALRGANALGIVKRNGESTWRAIPFAKKTSALVAGAGIVAWIGASSATTDGDVLMVSRDEGATWSVPTGAPILGDFANDLVIEPDGTLRLMTSNEADCGGGFQERWIGDLTTNTWKEATWPLDTPGRWGIGDEGWSYAVGNCGDGVESKLCAVDPAGNAIAVAVARGATFKGMHAVTNGRATWAMLDGKLAWLSRGTVMFPAGAAPKGFALLAVDAEGQPIGIAEGHATRWSRDGKWRAIFGH